MCYKLAVKRIEDMKKRGFNWWMCFGRIGAAQFLFPLGSLRGKKERVWGPGKRINKLPWVLRSWIPTSIGESASGLFCEWST
jgi:hypothetical protein